MNYMRSSNKAVYYLFIYFYYIFEEGFLAHTKLEMKLELTHAKESANKLNLTSNFSSETNKSLFILLRN